MAERKIYTTRLERIEDHTPSVKSFFLRLPPDQKFLFAAGQFLSIHLKKHGIAIRKPYSIASSPADPTLLELCVKRVEGGYVTNELFNYEIGREIPIDGPDGVFTLKNSLDSDLYFIGAGTGIAPLRSMILSLFSDHFERPVFLLFGVRKENEILYEKEFREMENQHPNFHFVPTISRPEKWAGEKGYVQEHLEHLVQKPDNKKFFICGLNPMVTAVREKLKTLGVDRKAIHYEKYV